MTTTSPTPSGPTPSRLFRRDQDLMKMMTGQPTPWELELIHADAELRQIAREQAMLDILKLMHAHDISCEQICQIAAARLEACPS